MKGTGRRRAATLMLAATFTVVLGAAAHAAGAAPGAAMAMPFGLPDVKLRTVLVGVHLAGLCLGVGGVLVLDALLAKAVLRGVFYAHNRSLVRVLSKTTGFGLALLWISGGAILLLYWRDQPELLANPKIHAKLLIVAALTLNGLLVERFCAPLIDGDEDTPLLVSFSGPMKLVAVFSGVFSAVSWYAAAFLGVMREFNGVVPARTILEAWGLALLLGFGAACVAGVIMERRRLGHAQPDPLGWRRQTVSLADIQTRRRNFARH